MNPWAHEFDRGETRGGDSPRRRLTFAGDWAPVWLYEEAYRRDPLAIYGDLLPLFRESDLNLVNVETAISGRGAPIAKNGPCITVPPSVIPPMTEVPFHVACLANNHTLDFGAEALEDTLSHLRAAGIQTTGAGMTEAEVKRPLEMTVGEEPVVIINCGEAEACASIGGEPGVWCYELREVEGIIRRYRAEGERAVIVVYHGGREVAPSPPPYTVAILRGMAEAGAHAVIAHHPHVPQGMEIYQGVPIVYSLGNFVFRYNTPSYYQQVGLLAHLDLAEGKVVGISLTPYRMGNERLSLIAGKEKEALGAELRSWTDLLGDPAALEEVWLAFLMRAFPDPAAFLKGMGDLYAMAAADPATAAAKALNYFFAPAHREAAITLLHRYSRKAGQPPAEWAVERVHRWMTTPVK